MTISSYLLAFILTLVIEVSVAYPFINREKRLLFGVILVNCITHPVFGYSLWMNNIFNFVDISFSTLLFCELIIVLIEFLLLKIVSRKSDRELFFLSLLLNAVSFTVGQIIF